MVPWEELKYLVPFSAALVAAIGWVVNDWLKRRGTVKQSIAKKVDFQRALRAEIKAFSDGQRMSPESLDASMEEAQRHFADPAQSETYVPFIPRRKNDAVFEAILPEIHVLPEKVIYPVVVYYAQIRLIDNVTADMRTEEYANLPAERRCHLLVDYLKLLKYALVLARKALFSLEDGIKRLETGQ